MIVVISSCTRSRMENVLNAHRSLDIHAPTVSHLVVTVGGQEWKPWPGAWSVHVADDGPFNLSRARNAGAREAFARGATKIIFLDADCLVDADTIPVMSQAMDDEPDAIIGSAGVWMPKPGPDGYDIENITSMYVPEPDRPVPTEKGELFPLRLHDAWMMFGLCFGMTKSAWDTSEGAFGGFCEDFKGWGFEDTDYASMSMKAGIPIFLVGGAVAYHQHHRKVWPPVEHLEAIVHNAAVFYSRNPEGKIPLLREFELLGLVRIENKIPHIIREVPEDLSEFGGVVTVDE